MTPSVNDMVERGLSKPYAQAVYAWMGDMSLKYGLTDEDRTKLTNCLRRAQLDEERRAS